MNIHRDNNNPETEIYLRILRALIMRDLVHHWSSDTAALADCELIIARVSTEGLQFLTVTLPALGKALDKALATGLPFVRPIGFKPVRKHSQIPEFLGDLFWQLYDDSGHPRVRYNPEMDYSEWHAPERADATACDSDQLDGVGPSIVEPVPNIDLTIPANVITAIRQLAYSFYKLELPYTNEQSRRTVQQFVEVDQSLPNPGDFDHHNDHILRMARSLIGSVLSTYDPSDITPRHGPGSVATGERSGAKSRFSRIYTALEQEYPFTEYFVWSLSQVCDQLGEIQGLAVDSSACAKVTLVPKDSRGPRIISMEPLEIQWIQQGVQRSLYRHVENHRLTGGHVNFTDQTINRSLALQSSIDGRMATLDMKDASDRVSLELFRALFSGTRFYDCALACRSPRTKLPDGSILLMKKFAPMGSALCFPVEALCFWALCVSTLRAYTGMTRREACDRVYVYGDDLVVPTWAQEMVSFQLECYGLLLNKSKCCYSMDGCFRESCGLDAFGGHETTPTRIKRRPIGATVTWVPSWIAQSNELYRKGYKAAAGVLESEVRKTKLPVPVVDETWEGLGFKRPYACTYVNRSLKRRYNRRLQRVEWQVLAVRNRKVAPLYDGWQELLRVTSEKSLQRADESGRLFEAETLLELRSNLSDLGFLPHQSAGPKMRTYSNRSGEYLTTAWSCPVF
jgi:hypothetical protein